MKAVQISTPASLETLNVVELPAPPAPGPDEIRVRVHAASLNFRDALVAGGIFPAKPGLVPLSDAAGEVIEVGSNVREFSPGDKVISVFHPRWVAGHIDKADLDNSPGGPADGFAIQETTRPATHFTHAPANLSFIEAACLPCAGLTAWRAVVTDGGVSPADTVLVQGSGGVSLFALQFAKACGARVIATSTSSAKLDRLRQLGADEVIDVRAAPEWGAKVKELTNGRGVSHIIEVGGPHTMGQSMIAARTGAHIAIIGAVAGFDIDTMPFAIVQAQRLRLQGVTVGSREDQTNMVRAIEAHDIHPVIDCEFPLEDLSGAFARLKSGGHFGKVCITL